MIVNCPSCNKAYSVPDEKAGIKFRCKSCRTVVETGAVDSLPEVEEICNAQLPEEKSHFLVSPKGPLKLPLDRDFIFGRALESDYLLEDVRSSRQHARLRWNGAAFLLADMGSRNGTHYKGMLIDAPVPVHNGEQFEIASESFTYRAVSDESDLERHLRDSRRLRRHCDTEELPALGRSLPTNDFNGNLASMRPPEICQILHLGQRSGRLVILDSERTRCLFYFHNGDIVGADYRGEKGDQAVVQGLSIRQGVFSFQHGLQCNRPNVEKQTSFLLLEAARQVDEV